LGVINTLRAQNATLKNKLREQKNALQKYAEEYYLLGNECIVSYKDNRAALANFDKALELYPEYLDAWVRKGVTYYDMKAYYDADVCFNRAVELSPQNFKVCYNRGKNRLAMKEYELAAKDLRKASALKPEHAACHEYLSEAYNLLGDKLLANQHLLLAQTIRNARSE
jgi:tetratricopeptide (TPR) repeat protein